MPNTSGFVDEDELGAWLSDKPLGWAQAIAARNALRVFPLVFFNKSITDRGTLDPILSVWRANFLSWAACKYPTRDMAVCASNAAIAVRVTTNPNAVVSASAAAAKAAAESTRARVTSSAIAAVRDTTSAGVRAVEAAVRADGTVPSYETTGNILWEAVKADCQYLLNGKGDLIEQPLWLIDVRGDPNYVVNFPIWVRRPFDEFANSSLAKSTSWKLIAGWYRALLQNPMGAKPRSLFGEKADIEIATQADEFWNHAPQLVMAAISAIVTNEDLHGPKAGDLFDDVEETVNVPSQQPAPVETAVVNDAVVRVHSDHVANRPDIEAIHAILVSEAPFLAGRIDRQAPDAVASINSVSQELGARLDDMRIYGVGYWAGVLNQIAGRIDQAVLDDAAGRFSGFLTNLNLFLRHSEDWNAYIQTAQNAELAGVIGSEAQIRTPQIIEELAENSGIVAEEVSGPLALLNKALLDAPMYNPETAYGLYRSLANVLQAVVELSLKDGVGHLRRFAEDVGVDARKKAVSWTAGGLLIACGSGLLVLANTIPSMFGFLNPIFRILGIG